eukprot:SAG31_NODE_586_length_13839_cov_22.698544_11_plen_772_part_00
MITLDQLHRLQPQEVLISAVYDEFMLAADDSEPHGLSSFLSTLAAYMPQLANIDGIEVGPASWSGIVQKIGKKTGWARERMARIEPSNRSNGPGNGDGCISFFAARNPGPADKPRRVQPIASIAAAKLVGLKVTTEHDEFLLRSPPGQPDAVVHLLAAVRAAREHRLGLAMTVDSQHRLLPPPLRNASPPSVALSPSQKRQESQWSAAIVAATKASTLGELVDDDLECEPVCPRAAITEPTYHAAAPEKTFERPARQITQNHQLQQTNLLAQSPAQQCFHQNSEHDARYATPRTYAKLKADYAELRSELSTAERESIEAELMELRPQLPSHTARTESRHENSSNIAAVIQSEPEHDHAVHHHHGSSQPGQSTCVNSDSDSGGSVSYSYTLYSYDSPKTTDEGAATNAVIAHGGCMGEGQQSEDSPKIGTLLPPLRAGVDRPSVADRRTGSAMCDTTAEDNIALAAGCVPPGFENPALSPIIKLAQARSAAQRILRGRTDLSVVGNQTQQLVNDPVISSEHETVSRSVGDRNAERVSEQQNACMDASSSQATKPEMTSIKQTIHKTGIEARTMTSAFSDSNLQTTVTNSQPDPQPAALQKTAAQAASRNKSGDTTRPASALERSRPKVTTLSPNGCHTPVQVYFVPAFDSARTSACTENDEAKTKAFEDDTSESGSSSSDSDSQSEDRHSIRESTADADADAAVAEMREIRAQLRERAARRATRRQMTSSQATSWDHDEVGSQSSTSVLAYRPPPPARSFDQQMDGKNSTRW